MKKIVLKFGGTCLENTARIQQAAAIVEKVVNENYQAVVVVSAMGHTTDQLIAMATEIRSTPDSRELDLLISTGEVVSATLMTVALHDRGLRSRSFTGPGAGILTDGNHCDARVLNIAISRLQHCLAMGQIPVVTGFQGLSENGEVTTLGRGGSDTTAIALAAALEAETCEIYTDVEGVYDVDPRKSDSARKFDFISYEHMLKLACNGAQVLCPRSVEIARSHNVKIQVRSAFSTEAKGTIVMDSMGPTLAMLPSLLGVEQ